MKIFIRLTLSIFAAMFLSTQAMAGVGPNDESWADITPGQNTLDTNQAASVVALVILSNNLEGCNTVIKLDTDNLIKDIDAGGNNLADFVEGGKFNNMMKIKYKTHDYTQLAMRTLLGGTDPCMFYIPLPYLFK